MRKRVLEQSEKQAGRRYRSKEQLFAVALFESLEGRLLLSATDLDTTFGLNGVAVMNFGGTAHFVAAAPQPDGKILAAGTVTTDTDTGTSGDFLLARYNMDGSADTTFGNGGFVTTDLSTVQGAASDDSAVGLGLAPDGKIIVAGNSDGQFAVVRYNVNGSLDTSFGGVGKVVTKVSSISSSASAVAVQADGKILLAGTASGDTTGGDFAVVRYTTSGALDSSFGTGGRVITDFTYTLNDGFADQVISAPQTVNAMALLPDGKILVAGSADVCGDCGIDRPGFAVARYNPNGTLDTTFGENNQGWSADAMGSPQRIANAIAVLPDGSFLLAGFDGFDQPTAQSFALNHYTPDGLIDSSFNGGQGDTTTFFTQPADHDLGTSATSITVLPNGQIMLIGIDSEDNGSDPSVVATHLAEARYNADGTIDANFGHIGTFISPALDSGEASYLQHDGTLVVAGASAGNAALARFEPAGTGTVSGTMYDDVNRNGANDAGDTPLEGWTAYVDVNDNGALDAGEPSALTGADGTYTISGLPAGTYRVREIRQTGYDRTEPAGAFPLGYYDLTLADGQSLTGNNFGNDPTAGGAPHNQAPLASADSATTAQGTPVIINVIGNDTDDSGLATGTVRIVAAPGHGSVLVNPVTGDVTYTPASGFIGNDTFTYTVKDNQALTSNAASVSVSVTPKVVTPPPSDSPFSATVSSSLPASVIGGVKVRGRVSVTVTNTTSTPFMGPVSIGLFASTDAALDATDAAFASKAVKRLKLRPGQSKVIKVKIKRAPVVDDGDYTLLARVAGPTGGPAVAASPGTLHIAAPFVNLTGTFAQTLTGPVAAGSKPLVLLNVANQGNLPVNRTVTVAFSAVPESGGDTVALSTRAIHLNLKPGENRTYKLKVLIPTALAANSYRLVAVIDSAHQISERSEGDNTVASSSTFLIA